MAVALTAKLRTAEARSAVLGVAKRKCAPAPEAHSGRARKEASAKRIGGRRDRAEDGRRSDPSPKPITPSPDGPFLAPPSLDQGSLRPARRPARPQGPSGKKAVMTRWRAIFPHAALQSFRPRTPPRPREETTPTVTRPAQATHIALEAGPVLATRNAGAARPA